MFIDIILLNPVESKNLITLIQDSKDIFLWLLATIFAIYIPLVIHYYQTIDKSKLNKLDTNIFHLKYFNLNKLLWFIWIYILWLLTIYFKPIIWTILIIIGLLLLLKNLNFLYSWYKNFKSKDLNNQRINFIKKLKLNKNNNEILIEILENKNIFLDFYFSENFLEIFFGKLTKKLKKDIKSKKMWDFWKSKNYIENLVKKLSNIFFQKEQTPDYIFIDELLKIYSEIYNLLDKSKILRTSLDIIQKILIEKIEFCIKNNLNEWIVYPISSYLKGINKEHQNYFIINFNNKIINSRIILEDNNFMKEYWEKIINNNKDKTIMKNILVFLLRKSYKLDSDKNYENILQYWLLDFDPILLWDILHLYFYLWNWKKLLQSTRKILENKSTYWFYSDRLNKIKETYNYIKNNFKIDKSVFKKLKKEFKNIKKSQETSEIHKQKCDIYIEIINNLLN